MGTPLWASELPRHILLSTSQITRLEALREDACVSHADFHLFVRSHPECSKMLQRQVYQCIRENDPEAPEEFVLAQLICSRLSAALKTGSDLFDLGQRVSIKGASSPEEYLVAIVELIRTRKWNAAKEVIDAIAEEEEKLPAIAPSSDLVETVRQASAILAERTEGISENAEREVAEAIAAFRFLAGRGGLPLDDKDATLLKRELPRDTISWRGGIRDTPSGGVTFGEAIDCGLLDEDEARRASMMVASAYQGFYEAAADGISLTSLNAVKEWYGQSVEDNYPEAGESFLQFATTYWTFKVVLRRLDLEQSTTLVRALLARIDALIGDLFFPFGPSAIDPARRETDQRRFLEAFASRINVEDFLRENPILIRDRKSSNKKWWT